MGTIRALALQPGREPAEIELDGNVDSINFFIFRNDSDARPITWLELEDGLDLIFAETTMEERKVLGALECPNPWNMYIYGPALLVRYEADDHSVFLDLNDADMIKYKRLLGMPIE